MPNTTTYQLKRAAVRLWRSTDFPAVPKPAQRRNQQAWLSAVAFLGPRWIINNPVPRKEHPND